MMTSDYLIHDFKNICHKNGLKFTPQRLEIYREVISFDGHPSVELIYQKIRERLPSVSLDTVYRTLTTFVEHDIISRVTALSDRVRYEKKRDDHHHLICEKCGRIDDFYWPRIDLEALPAEVAEWGEITIRRLEIRGICRECQDKK